MKPKVAIVKVDDSINEAFKKALKYIGEIEDLNTKNRSVVIKVGVFDPKIGNYPTVDVVSAIVDGFSKASRIFIAESDNYKGTGTERLQIWKSLFTERVMPFNLSEDADTREVDIGGEKMHFSRILFKPNVLVSVHALRKYVKGTIIKNLFGLVPERKKAKFHKKLEAVLLDTFEVVGGVDLAVIDATRTYPGPTARKALNTNVLIVGRDAVAVETVGAILVGLKLEKVRVIQEAAKKGFGEGDIEKIEVVGDSIESIKGRFKA